MKNRTLTTLKVAKVIALAASTFCTLLHAQSDRANVLQLRLDQVLRSALPPHVSSAAPDLVSTASSAPLLSCSQLSAAALNQLTLLNAMAHVLCKNPVLNQALLLIDEQQASSDLAQSAFRPRLSARAELTARGIPSSNSGAGFLNSSATGAIGLSWVLFDSGARAANFEQSRQVLNSARAGQQAVALNAVNEALRLYVDAATANSRLDALRETESVARQSVEAVQAKYDAYVVSLAEKLQAQTALAQATLDRVRAEGVWQTARGLLALAMGFSATQAFTLAPVNTAFPGSKGQAGTSDLIQVAKRQHPRVLGGLADVQALKSRLDAIRAERWGAIAISASTGSTKDLSTDGSRFQSRVSGGLIASIPIFNGPEQQARENQVLAQIASREESVAQIERDLESEVWRNAKLLETETQNLQAAQQLLSAASQSYQITFGRYKAGVGSILELITTQSALSTARSQMAQAQIAMAAARLRLEVASGRMLLSP